VAAFLSAAWLQDLDAAARSSAALAAVGRHGRVVIEQQVTGTPRGDVTYHFVFDSEGARVHRGSANDANVVIVTDSATAAALHAGEINAQGALTTKRLKLKGDIDLLVRHAEALKALDDVFAAVRATTAVNAA
jgi:hypothetical protein